jgi:HD-like signal output (HDOD) protein
VAGASHFASVPFGHLPEHWRSLGAVFLTAGQVEITGADGGRVVLSSVSSPARFPLPLLPGYQIRVVHPTTFLLVPPEGAPEVVRGGGGARESADDPADARSKAVLEMLEENMRDGRLPLPSVPDLAFRLNAAIRDPDVPNKDVAKLIQLDPALAAKVMHVVNSAAFRFRQDARNVQQAVTRLGRKRIQNLTFGFLVRSAFTARSGSLRRRANALWRQSCHVAAISFTLADRLPCVDPDRAMLAGLIHKIGALPIIGLAQQKPQAFPDESSLEEAIQHLRQPLGHIVVEHWKLGDDLVGVVTHAEDWWRTGYAVPDYVDVVLLAQLHTYVGTPHMHEVPRIDELPAFRKLGMGKLTPRRSLAVLEEADHEIRELRHLLAGR